MIQGFKLPKVTFKLEFRDDADPDYSAGYDY